VFARALRQAEFLRLPLDGLETDHTRSELETRFLALLRRHRLPQPEVNVRIGTFVVDFLWRAERLVVELDGWGAHRSRSAFEADRARDARLKMLGHQVLRFTWRQVTEDSGGVAATIRSLLTALW
jgi:very-short-patch-repair endonuclease